MPLKWEVWNVGAWATLLKYAQLKYTKVQPLSQLGKLLTYWNPSFLIHEFKMLYILILLKNRLLAYYTAYAEASFPLSGSSKYPWLIVCHSFQVCAST